VFSTHGRILIMTTNHPKVLDEALIRPGRIDCKYLFDNCDSNQIKNLFIMFFNKEPNQQLLKLIKNNKYSPAHITSIFLRYRNNPDEALQHLDDVCTKIFLPQREIYDKNIINNNNDNDNSDINNLSKLDSLKLDSQKLDSQKLDSMMYLMTNMKFPIIENNDAIQNTVYEQINNNNLSYVELKCIDPIKMIGELPIIENKVSKDFM
jgi:SpoVK/Ycf46/Vps4 family AAA+-type ATPase